MYRIVGLHFKGKHLNMYPVNSKDTFWDRQMCPV